jgi:hypothetical protein
MYARRCIAATFVGRRTGCEQAAQMTISRLRIPPNFSLPRSTAASAQARSRPNNLRIGDVGDQGGVQPRSNTCCQKTP